MKCSCEIELKALQIQKMEYKLCPKCGLLSKVSTLSYEEERKRYDLHQWDENYITYMKQVYSEIIKYVQKGKILDYGCGKIHALRDIFCAEGMECDFYDLHYFPNEKLRTYDTIILIEVFEHLKKPYDVLNFLVKKLNKRGRIIIKTKPYDEKELEGWWYLRDETHINFLLKKTLTYWKLNLKMLEQKGDIFVLERI